jgi:hypothetical protein
MTSSQFCHEPKTALKNKYCKSNLMARVPARVRKKWNIHALLMGRQSHRTILENRLMISYETQHTEP